MINLVVSIGYVNPLQGKENRPCLFVIQMKMLFVFVNKFFIPFEHGHWVIETWVAVFNSMVWCLSIIISAFDTPMAPKS